MEKKIIYGIQQVGIGVSNAEEAFRWYATKLGSDVLVFDDNNTATYMARYMGGKPRRKRALLAMNLKGGSGYEIWQYLDRQPAKPKQDLLVGDLGINYITVKTKDIGSCFQDLKSKEVHLLTDIIEDPSGKPVFFIQDPYGNILQIRSSNSWFAKKKVDVGGISGCTLGVSDLDHSRRLYSDILGYTEVVYDETGHFPDIAALPGGEQTMRRVLLRATERRCGGFSELFGESQLELIQVLDREPNKIFEDRYWGDLGFIHLCFDIKYMKSLVQECEQKGFPFKVLSSEDFDMGDANGHWGYLEDPDGTLIEFVETHKVPLVKKLNWYIDLRKRNPLKPLPNWLIKAMSFNRVRF